MINNVIQFKTNNIMPNMIEDFELEFSEKGKLTGTGRQYLLAVRKFFNRNLNELKLMSPQGLNITITEVIKYFRKMFDEEYSDNYIINQLSGLTNFYQFIISWERDNDFLLQQNHLTQITFNPFKEDRVKRFMKRNCTITCIDESQYVDINDAIKILNVIDDSKPLGVRNKIIVRILLNCGLRRQEASNLKVKNIYYSKKHERWFLAVIKGKGKKNRRIDLNENFVQDIFKWVKLRHLKSKDYLFPSNKGGNLSGDGIYYVVKKYAEMVGLSEKIAPHDMRRICATDEIEDGKDIIDIANGTGHSDINTLAIYKHKFDNGNKVIFGDRNY